MVTTITTTAGEDARISVAFGSYLGLPGNANAAQVKAAIAVWVAGIVRGYEAGAAAAAASASTPIAPT